MAGSLASNMPNDHSPDIDASNVGSIEISPLRETVIIRTKRPSFASKRCRAAASWAWPPIPRPARACAINVLAQVKAALNDLDRVTRVIKVLGMVNAVPDFQNHPAVINGCSELFRDLWGSNHGVGARSAVGMGSLPGHITTEIEAIFEIDLSLVDRSIESE